MTAEFLERSAVGLTEQQQLAHGQMLRYRLDSYLSLLSRLEERDEAGFRAALAWKGSTLVRQRAMRLLADKPEIAEKFAELQQVTRRWARLATAVPPPQQAQHFQEQIAALHAEKEELEAQLSRSSAAFRDANQQITLENLLSSLSPGTALVDFLEYEYSTGSNCRNGAASAYGSSKPMTEPSSPS